MTPDLVNSLRINEWMDTVLIVSTSCILSIFFGPDIMANLRHYFVFMVYLISVLVYGFLVNSYADRKEDMAVGKNVVFSKLSKFWIISVVVISGGAFLVVPTLVSNLNVIFFNFFVFLVATFYSVRPVRLKERGLMGVIASASARGSLPFVIFIHIAKIPIIMGAYFLVWMFLSEFVGDILHHIIDYHNDVQTKTSTWITRMGLRRSKKILRIFLVVLFLYGFSALFLFELLVGIFFAVVMTIVTSHIYLEDLLG